MDNQNQPSQTSSSQNYPLFFGQRMRTIVIVSLVVGLVFAVILIIPLLRAPRSQVVNQPSSIPTVAPTPPTSGLDMENWKTYSNTQYNFSMKYPVNWIIDDSTARVYIKSPDLSSSSVTNYYFILRGARLVIEGSLRSGVNIQEVISARLHDCAKKTFKENLIIDGYKAQRYEIHCPGYSPDAQLIFIDKNNQIYDLDFDYVASNTINYPLLFEQILSTFRFIQ